MTNLATQAWASNTDRHRTLGERAFSALHAGIVTGELAPGQRLRIGELAAALDMSHLPIREAIRQLESRGLVEHVPHRGARVTELSLEDLIEIYEARLLLEPEIIERASTSFTDTDADIARAALWHHGEAIAHGRRVEAWKAHTDFHFALYAPSKATWMVRLITPLWESSQRYRLTIPAVNAERRLREAAVEHEDILAACMAHDAEHAQAALHDHLARSANLITSHLGGTHVFSLWSDR